jgi:hypothetical protein
VHHALTAESKLFCLYLDKDTVAAKTAQGARIGPGDTADIAETAEGRPTGRVAQAVVEPRPISAQMSRAGAMKVGNVRTLLFRILRVRGEDGTALVEHRAG